MGGREGERERGKNSLIGHLTAPSPHLIFIGWEMDENGEIYSWKVKICQEKWREGRMAVWPHDSSLYLTTLPPPFLPFISIPHHLQLP